MKQNGWAALGTKTFKIENLDSHCQRLKLDTPESPKSHAECLEHNRLNIDILPVK